LNFFHRWSNITLKSITKRNRELPEEIVAKSESRNEEKRKPITNGCQNPAQNKIKGIKRSVLTG
jgi:hypothetical protein